MSEHYRAVTRAGRRVALVLSVAVASMIVAATTTAGAATTATTEVISGTLPDGTLWRVAKPTPWNGTLILDLDGFGSANPTTPGALQTWMTDHGYAIGGTQREPVGYRFRQAVDNLLMVRTTFTTSFGTPTRTLTMGGSRGGFVSRLAMEWYPEIFEGALLSAGGGAGEIATFNSHLDGLFTLKTLVDPTAPIPLANVTTPFVDNAAINALVRQAMATAEGRARLGLAAAFEQMPLWTMGTAPAPEGDAEAWIQQIGGELNPVVGTVFGFANPAQVRQGIELAAGGNPLWNDGVDYTELLARSGRAQLVRELYAAARLDLNADLATLAAAPRVSADPAALASAEQQMAYTGEIRGPVIVVDNIGDPVDSEAYKEAYTRTVRGAGNERLLRTTWVASAGHGNQTVLERLSGFFKLIERLDTGKWSSTSADAMTEAAAAIDAESDLALGISRFIDHHPLKPLREWDGKDFGTYDFGGLISVDGRRGGSGRSVGRRRVRCGRSSRFRIFPVGPFGSSSTTTIRRGYLYAATRAASPTPGGRPGTRSRPAEAPPVPRPPRRASRAGCRSPPPRAPPDARRASPRPRAGRRCNRRG